MPNKFTDEELAVFAEGEAQVAKFGRLVAGSNLYTLCRRLDSYSQAISSGKGPPPGWYRDAIGSLVKVAKQLDGIFAGIDKGPAEKFREALTKELPNDRQQQRPSTQE